MSTSDKIKMTFDAGKLALSQPKGTAQLLSAAATMERASGAGVTATQLQAIFPDLQKFPTAHVEGFMGISHGLLHGEVAIPTTLSFEIETELESEVSVSSTSN